MVDIKFEQVDVTKLISRPFASTILPSKLFLNWMLTLVNLRVPIEFGEELVEVALSVSVDPAEWTASPAAYKSTRPQALN